MTSTTTTTKPLHTGRALRTLRHRRTYSGAGPSCRPTPGRTTVSARRSERVCLGTGAQRGEAVARHALIAIRVLMGVLFVVCGLTAVLGAAPRPQTTVIGAAFPLGGALMVAGSMLPLLKGIEVLVATLLDLYQSLCSGAYSSVEVQTHAALGSRGQVDSMDSHDGTAIASQVHHRDT